jgi:triphosphatase
MKLEIELKYILEPGDIEKILGHPLLICHESVEHHLISHYYDTAERWLYRQGYALRVRKQEGQYIQTLKALGVSAEALHERLEWERPIHSLPIDPQEIPVPALQVPVKDFLLMGQLLCLFTTDFMRRSWFLNVNGAEVEVAIDQGQIIKGDKIERISELEIELLKGEKAALINFADEIATRFQLMPQKQNKAERANFL